MLSPQLTAAMLLCMPKIILVGILLEKSMYKFSAGVQKKITKVITVGEEAIQNIRIVRTFATENQETEIFSKEVEHESELYKNLGLDIDLFQNIKFENVEFSYPIQPDLVILKNFNLAIPIGKTVSIVGSSGNGKSTIAVLLKRFYNIDENSISIDKLDITFLNSNYLRCIVLVYINQEPIFFATSIK
ncbi:hypothetical protein HZH66_011971 [Vespula vulgaris]|uniref:ABC transmembrane type-1 domain-containing protein n=1 Tax=Vespula vulgaris TaxID=7454 RepID=A0A834MTQ3_VESVU|nr:hypothetical protein HZH66_011971 [Vespula vulgaris]